MCPPPNLSQRDWEALVKELGIVGATRFVMAAERGSGDSVERYAKLWEGMSLEEVHEDILRAKASGQI